MANFGGNANNITGNPSEPSAPPKPDLEIATNIAAKNVTGITISKPFIEFKILKAVSIKIYSL